MLTETDAEWLDVTALRSESQLHVALTNMYGRQRSADLSSLCEGLTIQSASQRRLLFRDGNIIFQDEPIDIDLKSIPVDVGETTLITLKLDSPLIPTGKLERRAWYAPETAVRAGESASAFDIQVDPAINPTKARLVIGVSRQGGLDGKLTARLNDEVLNVHREWLGEFQNLFAPVSIEVSVESLRAMNSISIDAPDGTTITSVHLETDVLD
ncbi:MAG: hypothetical protein AAF802_23980 [Planctomycetota bacterium]